MLTEKKNLSNGEGVTGCRTSPLSKLQKITRCEQFNLLKVHLIFSSLFRKKKRHDLGVLKSTTLKLLQGVITLLILMQLTVSHKRHLSTFPNFQNHVHLCRQSVVRTSDSEQSKFSFLVSFELKWSIFLRFPIK